MFLASKTSTASKVFLLFFVGYHLNFFFVDAIPDQKIHFYYNSPLYPSVYRVVGGSITGIQKAFDDHNHDTIAKDDKFTVLVNFSLPIYNKERQWYEIPARICYGKDIEGCLNQTRPFSSPYLVRPSSAVIPVLFVVPFSKMYDATLPDGKTVYGAGTVHEQFKTFEVNGAKYDPSTGILVSFSAESPQKAGKISNIEFVRESGKVLRNQPLPQCYFPEWASDGCVPGLDNVMRGFDAKFRQLKNRRWLKAGKFPNHRDDKYLQTFYIPGIGRKNYLVFDFMVLEELSPMAKPFFHLFTSVEEQVNTTLKSVGLDFSKELFSPSGIKHQRYSKHYGKQAYLATMSEIEYRLFRATVSKTYLEDEANWDDGFKKGLKSVLDGRSKRDAMDFFRKYGTHYFEKTVMGGRREEVFTVIYCEVSKEKKAGFEAAIKKLYKSSSSKVRMEDYIKIHYPAKNMFWGPQITCTGGNSLDLEICNNVTLWKRTVWTNPYPIKMTLKPFYTLVKDPDDRLWLEEKYKEHLKADFDEVQINRNINLTCSQPDVEASPGHEGSIMPILIIVIIIMSVILIICFCVGAGFWVWRARNQVVARNIENRLQ